MEKSPKNPSVFLFPHTYIAKPEYEAIRSEFPGLIVCRPWHAEDSPPEGRSNSSPVPKRYPPEGLKPEGDFRRLLAEYLGWMRLNRGGDWAAFLQSIQDADASETHAWNIRGMIRSVGKSVSGDSSVPVLKWHLVLHLAREIQMDRLEMARMLVQVKEKGAPLKEALGEAPSPPGLFEDIYPADPYSLPEKTRLAQVLEAWLGLFGSYLEENSLLVTLDPFVLSYIAEHLVEDGVAFSSSHPQVPKDASAGITVPFPVRESGHSKRAAGLSGLYGKTLILWKPGDNS